MQNTKEVLKLEDFNLSSRVLWLLARNNIDRVKLTSITYNELKAIPTMGNEKISEIKRELERKGFYNIVVPNMSSESRLVKQQYKESLLNEIKEILLNHSSVSSNVNSIDDFIIDELITYYASLTFKNLEMKLKKIKNLI